VRACTLALLAVFEVTGVCAGPVVVYREGPKFCPHDLPKGSPRLSQAQAIERARTMLPADFCGPTTFVTGCDFEPEYSLEAWRIYVHQYNDRSGQRDRSGLDHTYVILDPAGNCLANIPGTNFGAPN
jgi:hypothetical protein